MSERTLATPAFPAKLKDVPFPWRARVAEFARGAFAFALLVGLYYVTNSHDQNDTLDAVSWMQEGNVYRLLEYRHLLWRILPFWIYRGLEAAGFSISPLNLLCGWDFLASAASLLLLFQVALKMLQSRAMAFGVTFAYGTAHCVWMYSGTGRLYTFSLLLAFAAYYLALHIEEETREGRRWLLIVSAAAYVCIAALFWLVHALNAIGVGLLVMLLPKGAGWLRRAGYLAGYALAGLLIGAAIGYSCLTYANIPVQGPGLQHWMKVSEDAPPVVFDALSPMKASYGQAHGIVAIYDLPYMINGVLLKDPHLIRVGNLYWELGKFVLVWVCLALAYVAPLALLPKVSVRSRKLVVALYVPVALNFIFALGWLGTDEQRYMPSLLSVLALAAMSLQEVGARWPGWRWTWVATAACLVLFAGVNLLEAVLPAQQRYLQLRAELASLRPLFKKGDIVLTFGHDVAQGMGPYLGLYTGASFMPLTEDPRYYNWDRADWKEYFTDRVVPWIERRKGRIFMQDRAVLGNNPVEAGWSEKQHPRPTVREYAGFMRENFCVRRAFSLIGNDYYEVARKRGSCPAGALPPELEPSR